MWNKKNTPPILQMLFLLPCKVQIHRHTYTCIYTYIFNIITHSPTNLCKSLLANFETRQRQRLVAKKRTWTAYFEIPQIYFTSSPVSLFFSFASFASLLATLATSRATRRINPKIQFQFRFQYKPHAGYQFQFQFAASTELADPRCSVACKLIKILNPQRDSINVSNNNNSNENNNNNCSMNICEWLKKSRQQKCFSKKLFYTPKTPTKKYLLSRLLRILLFRNWVN